MKVNNLNWDFLSIYISHAVSYSRVCLSLWHRSNIGLSKLTLCAVSSPQKCTSAQSLDLWLSTFLESTPFDVANWPLFAPIYLNQICSLLFYLSFSVWIRNTNLPPPTPYWDTMMHILSAREGTPSFSKQLWTLDFEKLRVRSPKQILGNGMRGYPTLPLYGRLFLSKNILLSFLY